MNDSRNGTGHQCVTMSYDYNNNMMMIHEYSNKIFLLYVAGEYKYVRMYVYKRIMHIHASNAMYLRIYH